MKSVVIAGSASLQAEVSKWVTFWQDRNFSVLDYPRPIAAEKFIREYPTVFQNFFDRIQETDVFFVMNENKNGMSGYIGAETFAELAFAVYLRLKAKNKPEIVLLQPPCVQMRGHDEIKVWHELGLIKYLSEFS
jgi:hypothetical protein